MMIEIGPNLAQVLSTIGIFIFWLVVIAVVVVLLGEICGDD